MKGDKSCYLTCSFEIEKEQAAKRADLSGVQLANKWWLDSSALVSAGFRGVLGYQSRQNGPIQPVQRPYFLDPTSRLFRSMGKARLVRLSQIRNRGNGVVICHEHRRRSSSPGICRWEWVTWLAGSELSSVIVCGNRAEWLTKCEPLQIAWPPACQARGFV